MKIFFELSENEGYVSPIKTAEALINSGDDLPAHLRLLPKHKKGFFGIRERHICENV